MSTGFIEFASGVPVSHMGPESVVGAEHCGVCAKAGQVARGVHAGKRFCDVWRAPVSVKQGCAMFERRQEGVAA